MPIKLAANNTMKKRKVKNARQIKKNTTKELLITEELQ